MENTHTDVKEERLNILEKKIHIKFLVILSLSNLLAMAISGNM